MSGQGLTHGSRTGERTSPTYGPGASDHQDTSRDTEFKRGTEDWDIHTTGSCTRRSIIGPSNVLRLEWESPSFSRNFRPRQTTRHPSQFPRRPRPLRGSRTVVSPRQDEEPGVHSTSFTASSRHYHQYRSVSVTGPYSDFVPLSPLIYGVGGGGRETRGRSLGRTGSR